jgi:Rrf2 family cysteine metabolism transcriptional repressor
MQLSTRARYGFRAMMELAARYEEGPVPLKEVAQCQTVSLKYLEQLFGRLRSAGLVKGMRGTGGGYVLARPPSRIRLSELFEVLEGSTALVECVDRPEICDQVKDCVTREVWVEIKDASDRILRERTLQDLVDRRAAKGAVGARMYEI